MIYLGTDFPEEFLGSYFYVDWVRKWIRVVEVDFSGQTPVVTRDSHSAHTGGQVLDFIEVPDGALYYMATSETGNAASFTGSIHRITFDGGIRVLQGQDIIIDPTEEVSTQVLHTVTFETDAVDPDDDAIIYQSDFSDGTDLDGDGNGDNANSTEQNPTWTNTAPAECTVEFNATDANGAANVFDPVVVRVGNAPVINITSPADEMTYRAGDSITLTGNTFDIEDGDLSTSAFWSVQFLHNEHNHPQLPATLNDAGGLSIVIPTIGHDYFDNTGFNVFLTANDSDGLTTTQQITIRPEETTITYDLPEVAGFGFQLDGVFYYNDITYDNVVNFEHTLTVPESYVDNGFIYEISHWSDDPLVTAAIRNFVVPDTDQTIAPIYIQTEQVSQAIMLTGGLVLLHLA